MPLPLTEHTALLAAKGVGIDSLAVLSKANACDILAQASAAVGSTCWKNSPRFGPTLTRPLSVQRTLS